MAGGFQPPVYAAPLGGAPFSERSLGKSLGRYLLESLWLRVSGQIWSECGGDDWRDFLSLLRSRYFSRESALRRAWLLSFSDKAAEHCLVSFGTASPGCAIRRCPRQAGPLRAGPRYPVRRNRAASRFPVFGPRCTKRLRRHLPGQTASHLLASRHQEASHMPPAHRLDPHKGRTTQWELIASPARAASPARQGSSIG